MRKTYIQNNDMSRFADYLEWLGDITTGTERVETATASGRVTADTVFANVCDPMYNAAAMDGIAVSAASTVSATEKNPLPLTEGEDFVYINTGNAVDPRFDAVIMIEDVTELGDGKVEITAPAYPWQHVRVKGESIVAGEMALPSMRRIRPVDVGAIYASGNIAVPAGPCRRTGFRRRWASSPRGTSWWTTPGSSRAENSWRATPRCSARSSRIAVA